MLLRPPSVTGEQKHLRLLQSFAIHADEMPRVLLRPRRTAFAWVYLGNAQNLYTLFDLTAGRNQARTKPFRKMK